MYRNLLFILELHCKLKYECNYDKDNVGLLTGM